MLSEQALKAGLTLLLGGLEVAFMRKLEAKWLEWQREVYDQAPGATHHSPAEYTNPDGSFKPNKEQARDRARASIHVGVGQRLRGAIALYGVGQQMECLRHIILALSAVCDFLDWEEASAWCESQNRALYEAHRRKEAVNGL
jgi:hypothetical protein